MSDYFQCKTNFVSSDDTHFGFHSVTLTQLVLSRHNVVCYDLKTN